MIVGLVLLLSVLVYLVVLAYGAHTEVVKAPKQEMFICEKHGPMPKSATYTLLDVELDTMGADGLPTREKPRTCPMCFEARIEEASRVK